MNLYQRQQALLRWSRAIRRVYDQRGGMVGNRADRKVERIQQSADIDIVGISEIDKTAVIGECKFKNERIDKNVYDTLIRRASRIIGKYKITKYLFFSLSGSTVSLMIMLF